MTHARGASTAALRLEPRSVFLIAGLVVLAGGCRKSEAPALTDIPVFPGASLRAAESAFQQRLYSIVLEPGQPLPRVRIYETSSTFASVLGFYERYFLPGSRAVQRFAVASRMRQLAEGARRGGSQQIAVGRLLFEERGAGGDSAGSASGAAIAESLAVLAERFEGLEGMIALGRIRLATEPAAEALISIERPHLSAATLSVDSLTVFTVVVQSPIKPSR